MSCRRCSILPALSYSDRCRICWQAWWIAMQFVGRLRKLSEP